jgi:hypothetical protein
MNRERALTEIRFFHPKTERDLLVRCKFGLKALGEGAYRDAYQIIGTDLVVKLPKLQSAMGYDPVSSKRLEYSIEHARMEVDAIKKIRRSKAKRWQIFKPLMPEILYFNFSYGVTVMPKYHKVGHHKHTDCIMKLDRIVSKYNDLEDCDVYNTGNWAEDAEGNLKLIDLGCFLEGNTTCPSA